ncbi:biotin transporter BioY [Anaerovorax odorimutans]|uniref:Biotin transporter n=1 Tax=Anaerovorax odorimutans TaxID=109327 RepID=A0ABT1RSR7_9FIRM|nr:biotin transporter BioY [Anaerovorax odorimutans]MCQ4638248.1 biotin transporter BioY [Anaerovorax odorimutans]
MSKAFSAQNMVLCALFTALIAIGAFIKIPVPVVPFTLQFLFTTLAGLFLGPGVGAASVILYLALGLAGLPIFAQGGGPGYVLIPSFGYLIGFAAGTWITGKMTEKIAAPSLKQLLTANFSGLAVVYLIGMAYYYLICNYVLGTPIAFWPLFLYCFLMAVPGDILICVICAFLARRLLPQIRRYVK